MTNPDSSASNTVPPDPLLERAGGWLVVLGFVLFACLLIVPVRAAITGDTGGLVFSVVWLGVASNVVAFGAALRRSPERVVMLWRSTVLVLDRLFQTPPRHEPPEDEDDAPSSAT